MTSRRFPSATGRESSPPSALSADSGLDPGPLLLFLRLPAGWMQVEATRVIGTFYCQVALDDADLVQRLTVIIHECVENAVKYAKPDSTSDLVLRIQRDRSRSWCRCAVTHPPACRLRAELARIGSVEPRRAFADAIARARPRPRRGEARPGADRHEGRAELSLAEHEGGTICLTARGSP
jgi:hypothetical protein